jgi:hypothetical protein
MTHCLISAFAFSHHRIRTAIYLPFFQYYFAYFLKMTTFGQNKELFSKILDDARSLAMESHSGKTIMYTVIGVDWRQFGHPRQRRPLNSVVLDEGVSEKLTEDVKEFIQVFSKINKETHLCLFITFEIFKSLT